MTKKHYQRIFEEGILDAIAITDHNAISYALEMQSVFGPKIIVGEEVDVRLGNLASKLNTNHNPAEKYEIVGLFLQNQIPPGSDLIGAIDAIHKQHGLVYIPHPNIRQRNGVPFEVLKHPEVLPSIDILEGFNARSLFWTKTNLRGMTFAREYELPYACSSDAHGFNELGSTYTIVNRLPTRSNLLKLLTNAQYAKEPVKPWKFLNPKFNVLSKKLESIKKTIFA